MKRVSPARVAAARVLLGVEAGGHAEDLLDELAPKEGSDRGMAWHLSLGVLRRRGALDHLLATRLKAGVEALDAPVRAVLRLGLFELKQSRTPPHAALSQAVELSRVVGARRASGLVNAVLRRLVEVPLPDDPYLDLPPWLALRWQPWPEWVARLREPASTTLATADRQPLAGLELEAAELQGEVVPGLWVLPSGRGRLEELPGFEQGAFWVMDPAAARVCDLALGAASGDSPRVLDACAAPGGKTMRLASGGAQVTAVDLAPHRLERLQENLARTGLSATVQVHDWSTGACEGLGDFEVVLVDAPCTGLGTVRRHPEIRWRRLASDPAAMALRQGPILAAAATHVAPGGALVYAVCSTEPEEGERVAQALPGWTIEGRWSSAPPTGDEDGFQAFVLRRTGEGSHGLQGA